MSAPLIIIGENIHCTRVVPRKSKRVIDAGGEAIRYLAASGEDHLLRIPEAAKSGQEYREGRIKHVMIALDMAMAGSEPERAAGRTYIAALAAAQERAGAAFLDLNVDEISFKLERQTAAMAWLVRALQEMTTLPLSVDSSNVDIIRAGLAVYDAARARPLLNSASLERSDAIYMAREFNARLVVTAAGEKGMPADAAERLANAGRLIELAARKGFAENDIFIDPLIFPISVDAAYGRHSLDAIRGLRARFGPSVHITGGMSNVSFGIPSRKLINDVFLVLAIEAGADSGIIDPVAARVEDVLALDRSAPTYRLAEDVLLGRDEHCRAYLRAWRKGELTVAVG
ncbi:MAG: hypothetical protein FJX56_02780 [Alphaproteobacteria bacterium]|nr:hypothetical protein [Alphaproteobacteria bacterium]